VEAHYCYIDAKKIDAKKMSRVFTLFVPVYQSLSRPQYTPQTHHGLEGPGLQPDDQAT
jgi:hypothetical protein